MDVINLNGKNKLEIIKKIKNLSEKYGFFYIKDQEVNENLLNKCFNEAKNFFAVSNTLKTNFSANKDSQYLGYRGMGTEKSLLTGKDELCEQLKFGYKYDYDLKSSKLVKLNIEEFNDINFSHSEMLFHIFEKISQELLRYIAASLKFEENYFEKISTRPMHQLGLNNYPMAQKKNPNETDSYAMSAHQDLSMITIIGQSHPGIVVKSNGKWITLPKREGCCIVLLGKYLELWTNELFISPEHYVIESKENNRISIIYKFRPNYDVEIPITEGINPNKNEFMNLKLFGVKTGLMYENKISSIMED